MKSTWAVTNYRYLPKRANGNALYHEVIVLEKQDHLPGEQIDKALHDLAERYCELRAPHQLAWGRVHRDTEFPHIHLMISANAVRSDRRVRMERKYFAQVQSDLETWRDKNMPELKARMIYGQEHIKETPRQTVQEGEMVRRNKAQSQKQQAYGVIQPIFGQSTNRADLKHRLRSAGFEYPS